MDHKHEREELRASIAKAVKSSKKPKDVLKTLRKSHPEVKSRDFALAAFSVMIDVSDSDAELASALHAFGLGERASKGN